MGMYILKNQCIINIGYAIIPKIIIINNIGWFKYVHVRKLDNNRVRKNKLKIYLIPHEQFFLMHMVLNFKLSVPLGRLTNCKLHTISL
jgi:hypothetical protein